MADNAISEEEAALVAARVYTLVRACPPGRVTTYGNLAIAVGYPKGARMVGWMMNAVPKHAEVPAQRVLNSKGELTGSWAFGQKGRMRQLLEAEGIAFTPEGRVDLKQYGWDPNTELSRPELDKLLQEAHVLGGEVSQYLMEKLRDDPASPFRIGRDQ